MSPGSARVRPSQSHATSAVRKATSLATAPPLAAVAAVVAGAAAPRVPSATAVVRLGTLLATAQTQRHTTAADTVADAAADTAVAVAVAVAVSAAQAKLATPVEVLDTSLGTVFKVASAITAAERATFPRIVRSHRGRLATIADQRTTSPVTAPRPVKAQREHLFFSQS